MVELNIAAMAVVIPAHNEQDALPECLTAVERALVEVAHREPDVSLRAFVVLDACTDGSAAIVESFTQAALHRGLFTIEGLHVNFGRVGLTRAAGFAAALADATDDELWIASTDADTLVPAHWLMTQLERARTGIDVLVGTIEPDAHLGARERAEWERRHHLVEGHPHVHGANLGMRASAYRASGGFAPLEQHEDVDLVARLRSMPGVNVEATDTTRAVTSSRMSGRAVGGFATYLANLRREVN